MVLQRQKQVVNSIEFIFRLVLATNIQMLSVGQETKNSQRAYYCWIRKKKLSWKVFFTKIPEQSEFVPWKTWGDREISTHKWNSSLSLNFFFEEKVFKLQKALLKLSCKTFWEGLKTKKTGFNKYLQHFAFGRKCFSPRTVLTFESSRTLDFSFFFVVFFVFFLEETKFRKYNKSANKKSVKKHSEFKMFTQIEYWEGGCNFQCVSFEGGRGEAPTHPPNLLRLCNHGKSGGNHLWVEISQVFQGTNSDCSGILVQKNFQLSFFLWIQQ